MALVDSIYQNIKNKKTNLAIGPISKNCVDSVIEIAEEIKTPLTLIASRRQIEMEELGGGYVNAWTTSTFSNYVKSKNKSKNVILARDHGGPWQNNIELNEKYNLKKAMLSAKKSLKEDIDAGFKFLHLDPSIDPFFKKIKLKDAQNRLFELLDFCNEYSKKKNIEVFYEIGTEEQTGTTVDFEEFENNLITIFEFCKKNKIKKPTFTVVQTGTKVMEMKNIGSFDSPFRIENELPVEIQVPKVIEICKKHKIFLKEHNADYLSNEAIKMHPKLGIHAINVAPEFGVEETKSFVEVLKITKNKKFLDQFLELSYKSYKWKKWMLKDSNASDYEKSLIAGHYVFADSNFKELKNRAKKNLSSKNIDLDFYLKKRIKSKIINYLKLLNLIT